MNIKRMLARASKQQLTPEEASRLISLLPDPHKCRRQKDADDIEKLQSKLLKIRNSRRR